MDFRLFPLVIIAVGALFLAINMEMVPASEIRSLIATWWPLAPIVLGLAMLGSRPRRRHADDRR
jgi:L-lactate permease